MQRPHLHFHLGEFLPHHLTRAVKQLVGSVAILGFAVSAVTLFEPIYLYTLGYPLRSIVGFYLIVYVLYVVLLPIGARFAARFGYARSMLIGSLLYIPYYLSLFGIERAPWLFFVAPIFFALQKSFYWPAFHADFARFSTAGEVGREIGETSLVVTAVSIIGPLVGGTIASVFGFSWLFVTVSILIFLSNIPLFRSKRNYPAEPYSYGLPFRALREKTNRPRVLAYAGYGEELVYMVLWPIFVFTVTAGIFRVGAIMTTAAVLVSLVLLIIGRWADQNRKRSLISAGSVAVSMSAFARVVAISAPLLLFAESAYRISRAAVDLPLLTDLYTRAKQRQVLTEASVFELSLSLGKILMMLALFGLLTLAPSPWYTIFLLSAIFALLFAQLPKAFTTDEKTPTPR